MRLKGKNVRALVSIHDVMPRTLFKVERIIERMPEHVRGNMVLLIVPGHCWTFSQVARLKTWQQAGFVLAGHGWKHHTDAIRSGYHRLHACLVSRNVAEHLSLSETGVQSLLNRNAAWFREQGLTVPDFYVPPAWAMGRISRTVLRQAPFRYFETANGIYDSVTHTFQFLPLAGFEADTPIRKISLETWNYLNKLLASDKYPLRIAIHPDDYQFLLADSIDRLLAQINRSVAYHELFGSNRIEKDMKD